ENRIARPEAERLLGRLGVAEVVGASEKLLRAVELARREQLLGPDDSQLGPELLADQVLTTFAAGERQIGGLRAHAARQEDEELCVFVVGMRADHQDALVAPELA